MFKMKTVRHSYTHLFIRLADKTNRFIGKPVKSSADTEKE